MNRVFFVYRYLLSSLKIVGTTLLLIDLLLLILEFVGLFDYLQIKTIILANQYTFRLSGQIIGLVGFFSFLLGVLAFEYDEDPYPIFYLGVSILFTGATLSVMCGPVISC